MDIYSISKVHSKFNKQQKIVIKLIQAKGKDWGMLETAITAIVGTQTAYTPLYDTSVNPITKSVGNTLLRNDYQDKTFYPALDGVYTKYLINNPLISVDDKAAMGIHSPNTNHTSIQNVTTSPIMKVTNGESLYQIITMRNAETNRIGKPPGVHFCEIWYKIGDPAPTDFSEANIKKNIKKSGTSILFDMADKGKMVYYFARWVMESGEWGPWTKLFSCIIA